MIVQLDLPLLLIMFALREVQSHFYRKLDKFARHSFVVCASEHVSSTTMQFN